MLTVILVTLKVESIHPAMWNKLAFEELVLAPASKHLISAVISESRTDNIYDTIARRGSSLIILLDGYVIPRVSL